MPLLRLRLRSALTLSSPFYQIRRQFYARGFNLKDNYTPISAACPLPIPRDPSLPPLKLPTDIINKFDGSPWYASTHVWSIVTALTQMSNLDAAAEYARLVVIADSPGRYDNKNETKIPEICQLVIGAMCEEKRYDKAYELFHYFFNVNCLAPDYDCCEYVLNALSYQGRLDDAIKFHKRVRSYAQFNLNPHALVKALINGGRILDAYDHFYDGYDHSHIDFIRGYLTDGNILRANRIFEELKQRSKSVNSRFDSKDEEIAMSQVAYMEHYFKEGKDEEAMEWYNSSLATRAAATGYVYQPAETVNTILQVLLKYGKKTEAWSLFDKMCGSDMSNNETRCIMARECFQTGEIGKALEMARKEAEAGNTGCYTTLVRAILRQGMMQQRERYPECVDEKIAMSRVAYMEHCFKQGKDEEAMEWYHSALATSRYGSKCAVNKVLRVLLKYGKKTEAWSLFDKLCGNSDIEEEAKKEDERSDEETLCIMIQECFETGDISKAMEIARKEAEAGNSGCYTILLTRLLREGMMSEAEEIFNEMFSSGRIPLYHDLWEYRMMVDGFVKAGRFDDAHRFVNKIAHVSTNAGGFAFVT